MNEPYFGPLPLLSLEVKLSLRFPDLFRFYSLGHGWAVASLYTPGPPHERPLPLCTVISPPG